MTPVDLFVNSIRGTAASAEVAAGTPFANVAAAVELDQLLRVALADLKIATPLKSASGGKFKPTNEIVLPDSEALVTVGEAVAV